MKIKDNVISKNERDCIVYLGKNRKNEFPLRISDISRELGLKLPSAELLVNKLQDKGIVIRNGGMVILSDDGSRMYDDIIMKHRVIEVFLADCGIDPDEACTEVSKFDYLIQEKNVLKIRNKIGNPEKCPHGLKIIEEQR